MGWEGLIAKRADGPYRSGRSRDWLKLKCVAQQEFVIGGYTDPSGSRAGLGALLVGYHDDGVLRFAGRVGTGFDEKTLRQLASMLADRERKTSPFDDAPAAEDVHWVTPDLVCQVGFTEWTHGRPPPAPAVPRSARRQGRRRSGPGDTEGDVVTTRTVAGRTIELSNLDKPYFPGGEAFPGDEPIRKGDVVDYYERIAEQMLPHVAGRPLVLQRFPDGIDGYGFYQKNTPDHVPDWIERVEIEHRRRRVDPVPRRRRRSRDRLLRQPGRDRVPHPARRRPTHRRRRSR